MNAIALIRTFLLVACAAGLAASTAPGADGSPPPAYGSVRGVALDPNGYPVASAEIALYGADGVTRRNAATDSAGVFAIESLKPGTYQITATRKSMPNRATTWVEVAPNQTAHPSVVFSAAGTMAAKPAPAAANVEQELAELRERVAVLEAALLARNTPPAQPTPAPDPIPSPVATPAPLPASTAPAVPQAAPTVDKVTPFADADWTWLNGNPRNKDTAFDTKFFTPEFRADITYTYDFNRPKDNSIGGSTEIFRSNEVQVEQLGVGGDFHWDNVRGRLMTQFGMYSQTTPRNDPSPGKGQWSLADAYRYLSEAYGGYHINALHGINVDAGIFMSYVGLFSYYNFDNWTYQPSYVSSNTPWFFEGVRIQVFPTNHLKIEPWIINGWQSYGSANSRKGLGGQIRWAPFPWLNIISNNYGLGQDDLYTPGRSRIHTDDSVEVKYYDRPDKPVSKMAFTFTGDLGCEYGGGVSCHGTTKGGPKQSFVGIMFYNRWWFHHDR